MATPVRSQTIFLDSSRAWGTNCDWGITLESGLVDCGADECMAVSVERFSCLASWTWLPAGAAFVYHDDSGGADVTVALPAGNPRLEDLAAGITSEIAATRPYFTCVFERTTGCLLFTSNYVMSLTFPSLATAALLGFTSVSVQSASTYHGDTLKAYWEDGTADNAVRSQQPLVPLPFRSIRIGVSGFTPLSRSLCNAGTNGAVQTCDTLAVVPVDSAPQTWLDYRNQPGANQMRVADKQLTQVRFAMTDDFGRPLTALPVQQFLQLRVDTYKTFDATCVLLSNILRTIQLVAVQNR